MRDVCWKCGEVLPTEKLVAVPHDGTTRVICRRHLEEMLDDFFSEEEE